MFYNEAGTNTRADVFIEQVAGSLSGLQEEVEGLEEAIQDMVCIMGQGKERKR